MQPTFLSVELHESLTLAASQASQGAGEMLVWAQNQVHDGPMGPEFGKASPIGLLVIVGLVVAIMMLGWSFHRRQSKFRRRRAFAEDHGLDPFDKQAVDAAMREAGVYDRR
ncbi:hypothetical protein [Corynebacterium sp.]|uniref:hypothetical protein n=1 Tax=Corynebacterium sp. TaxID=1720 RepID=UPI00359FEEFF